MAAGGASYAWEDRMATSTQAAERTVEYLRVPDNVREIDEPHVGALTCRPRP